MNVAFVLFATVLVALGVTNAMLYHDYRKRIAKVGAALDDDAFRAQANALGKVGALGVRGPPGLDGTPGTPGQPGAKGLDGGPGPAGNAGPPGALGAMGAPGAAGAPGVGQPGRDGEAASSGGGLLPLWILLGLGVLAVVGYLVYRSMKKSPQKGKTSKKSEENVPRKQSEPVFPDKYEGVGTVENFKIPDAGPPEEYVIKSERTTDTKRTHNARDTGPGPIENFKPGSTRERNRSNRIKKKHHK